MGKVMRAVGLMSGTSMDGIDIALIETDGEAHVRRLATASVEYPGDFRARLRQALASAVAIVDRDQRPGVLAAVERELTERHADAVVRFLGDRMLQPSAVDVIGFHGQTVLHRPEQRLTVQIGDGPLLARQTGIDVVYDLRGADCAAGGQGAPLVPVYHRALAARIGERPLALVNIGGVSNITWIGHAGDLRAFDTGPGNALIDDWMLRHTGAACDVDGMAAAAGMVDEAILSNYLSLPYFSRTPPKSLDRNAFSTEVEGLMQRLSLADAAATLTAFTAASIAMAAAHCPVQPSLWAITGGGRRNRTLMRMLAERTGGMVEPADSLGLDGDGMEAEAWAYLAVRSLIGLPITFPGTTGAPQAMTGGVLARA